MKIKLKLLMPFKNIVGREELNIEFEGSTLQDLLDHLTGEYPKFKKSLYNKEGNVDSFVNIFVNDKPTYTDQESQVTLKEGDDILIFPAIAGG